MSYARTALVTGANKGIGLAIVRNLALQYPSSTFNDGPFLIYLSARDQKRGEDAVESLYQDGQLKKAKALAEYGGLSTIKYHGMDISKPESIRDMANFIEKEHPEGIDIVVNNAGIAMDGFNMDVVKQTLQCNYYGTLEATQAFLPLIRPGGRLVNIASVVGLLNSKYSESIREKFAFSQTVRDVTNLMEVFSNAVQLGNHAEEGWPSAAYAVSKSGVIGMTRAIAKDEERRGRGVLVNSCCPGFVNTDMTKGRGVKTVDQGAETPVLLALGDIGGKSGEFWSKMKITRSLDPDPHEAQSRLMATHPHSHSLMRILLGRQNRIHARSPQCFPQTPLRRKTSAASKTQNELKTDAAALPPTGSTSAVKSPLLQRLGPLSKAANAYDRVQKSRPWTTQLCASLLVYFCGDQLAQYIDGEHYDPLRSIRHLTIGAGAAIPGYTWFMYLNTLFNYPSFLLSLAIKIIVNQIVFTPIFNSYFFGMQSILSGASIRDAYERVKNTLPTSFYNSCKLWPAVTAISFTYIAPQYRFLFAGGVAVGWQSYLSWLNQRAAEKERLLSDQNVGEVSSQHGG